MAALASGHASAQSAIQAEDDRYETTVVAFQTTVDTHGDRHAYLTLRLHNTTDKPLRLAADADNPPMADERGTWYVGGVRGAMGQILTGTAEASFVLRPGATADALIHFYTPEPPKAPPGTVFSATLRVADVTMDAKGRIAVGPTRPLRITGLTAAEFAPGKTGGGDAPPQALAEPFSARIVRATVAPEKYGKGEALVMTVEVTNRLAAPLYLAYTSFSGFAMDEHGHCYTQGGLTGGHYFLRGIPDLSIHDVDPRFVLAPGASRSFTFPVTNGGGTIPDGERLAVYFGLSTLKKDDDGKYHADQSYLLSFLYVRPDGRSPVPLGNNIPD
jgi:hypothetical protein